MISGSSRSGPNPTGSRRGTFTGLTVGADGVGGEPDGDDLADDRRERDDEDRDPERDDVPRLDEHPDGDEEHRGRDRRVAG